MFKKIFESLDIPINKPYYDFIYKPPIQRHISKYMYTERGYCQAGLLFYSKVGEQSNLEYLLVMVDMKKPYKVDAEIVQNKTPQAILNAFKKIFDRGIINQDDIKVIYCDDGSEFNNHLIKNYFKDNDIDIRFTLAGRKRQDAIVETMNGLLRQFLMGYNAYLNIQDRGTRINAWKPKLREFIGALNTYFEENQEPLTFEQILEAEDISKHEMENILKVGQKVYIPLQKPTSQRTKTFRRGQVRYHGEKYKVAEILFNPKWKQPRYIVIPENEDISNYPKKYNKVTYQRTELLKNLFSQSN